MRPPQKPRRLAPLRMLGALLYGVGILWCVALVAWPERVVLIGVVAVNDRACVRVHGDPRVFDLRLDAERKLLAARHGVIPRKLLFGWKPSRGVRPWKRWAWVAGQIFGARDGVSVHQRDASFAALLPVEPAPPAMAPTRTIVLQRLLSAAVTNSPDVRDVGVPDAWLAPDETR